MDIVFIVLALIAILEAGAIIWLLENMRKKDAETLKRRAESKPLQ